MTRNAKNLWYISFESQHCLLECKTHFNCLIYKLISQGLDLF